MSSSNNKRSSKRYLTEQERLEIIRKLSRPNPPSKRSLAEQVPFVGLDALYEQMLALEDQLLCKGFQDKMGEKYDKIISPFLVCLGRLR